MADVVVLCAGSNNFVCRSQAEIRTNQNQVLVISSNSADQTASCRFEIANLQDGIGHFVG